jgi:hypothetical protein
MHLDARVKFRARTAHPYSSQKVGPIGTLDSGVRVEARADECNVGIQLHA